MRERKRDEKIRRRREEKEENNRMHKISSNSEKVVFDTIAEDTENIPYWKTHKRNPSILQKILPDHKFHLFVRSVYKKLPIDVGQCQVEVVLRINGFDEKIHVTRECISHRGPKKNECDCHCYYSFFLDEKIKTYIHDTTQQLIKLIESKTGYKYEGIGDNDNSETYYRETAIRFQSKSVVFPTLKLLCEKQLRKTILTWDVIYKTPKHLIENLVEMNWRNQEEQEDSEESDTGDSN